MPLSWTADTACTRTWHRVRRRLTQTLAAVKLCFYVHALMKNTNNLNHAFRRALEENHVASLRKLSVAWHDLVASDSQGASG